MPVEYSEAISSTPSEPMISWPKSRPPLVIRYRREESMPAAAGSWPAASICSMPLAMPQPPSRPMPTITRTVVASSTQVERSVVNLIHSLFSVRGKLTPGPVTRPVWGVRVAALMVSFLPG